MKRALLVWAFGTFAFPLGFALWMWFDALRLLGKTQQNPGPVALVSKPFIDFNGQALSEVWLWALLALAGGFFSLACYGVMCFLFWALGRH